MKEAYLYTKLDDEKTRCDLCNHRCVLGDREKGKCSIRENRDGILYSLVYRKLISENVDPIEKKPLFHFQPGSYSLSIATVGCNFKCFFCQNYQISQMPRENGHIEGRDRSPKDIVDHAIEYDCKSISYTYTEPTVYFEYAYDTAKIAQERGLKNIFVTNGFMTKECIDMMSPYLDAANIDLKSFSEKTYKDRIGGRLKPVLENIKDLHYRGIWIEITTLVIPGINDSSKELENIACFIAGLDGSIPWHISAYHPQYKADIPPTSVDMIENTISIGKNAGLKYIYGGNIYFGNYENTKCPSCNSTVLSRRGFDVIKRNMTGEQCGNCGTVIDGVF
jgi:pyruvate formate lyase activating enzyme